MVSSYIIPIAIITGLVLVGLAIFGLISYKPKISDKEIKRLKSNIEKINGKGGEIANSNSIDKYPEIARQIVINQKIIETK